jgi:hypothetical protein
MRPVPEPTTNPLRPTAWTALMLAGLLLAGTWGGTAVLVDWATIGLLPLAWLAMAIGYGLVLRRALFRGMAGDDPRAWGLSVALGVSAALALDNAFGTWVGFRAGGLLGVWLIVLGLVPLVGALERECTRRGGRLPSWLDVPRLVLADAGDARSNGLRWLAAPAIAVLALVAALSPGLAWSSEFGGYDALAYHLQLPKEWMERGQIEPLRHNVYSAFPSFMEGAFLHLRSMTGTVDAGRSAQMLHALLAVAAAWVVGCLAAATVARTAGGDGSRAARARDVAFVAFLGIPWVTVTATLAYDEMPMLLCTAGAALVIASQDATGPRRLGCALGLCLAGAIGSKLTAVGMAALPALAMAALWPTHLRLRAWLAGAAPAAALVAVAIFAPWLARNLHAIGSATFPFGVAALGQAGSATGTDWWSAEQAARFAAGHGAGGVGWAERLAILWRTLFADGTLGIPEGGAGTPGAAWAAAWAPTAWLGIAAVAFVAARLRDRRAAAIAAMLALQLAFWLAATHLKARFLLPCAVPLACAIGCAGALLPRAPGVRWAPATLATAGLLLAWSLQPFAALEGDPRTSANAAMWSAAGDDRAIIGPGSRAAAEGLVAVGDPLPLAWIANWTLPADARLGCEGEADVYWFARTPDYGDVWDGGPLAAALRAHGDDADAAVRALRARGLTHLAIGEAMLARWKSAGWLDPALTPERVRAVAARLRPVARLASGGVLYALPAEGR